MRDSATPRDLRLAELAARQYGIVSLEQLRQLGFDREAIRRRVANGRLHRLYRGVYAVGHTVLNRHGRYLAATMACGPGAVLSHRSAAALWGIRPSDAARIDITVPRTSGVRSYAAIVVHRPKRAYEATRHEGIATTTPGQTLADLATALPRRALEKAAEQAEALRLDVAIPAGHPGAKRLHEATAHDLGSTTRSPLEDAFLELCDAHGIPRPLVNTVVAGFEVDFCWPDARHRGDRRARPSRHPGRVRARPRAGRAAHRARLAGAAVHRPAGSLGGRLGCGRPTRRGGTNRPTRRPPAP